VEAEAPQAEPPSGDSPEAETAEDLTAAAFSVEEEPVDAGTDNADNSALYSLLGKAPRADAGETPPESRAEEPNPETSVAGEALVPPSADNGESPVLNEIPVEFKQELRTVLSYMDILLESLPEEKIEEFARSEHFEPYKKLFRELGLV
jgi:hypothetical protein